MPDAIIVTHLEDLDRRLARVEQILPTLATKEDLGALATKEDLRTLATKDDLLAAREELRRHMDIVGEALRADIQLVAEHLASVMPKPREG